MAKKNKFIEDNFKDYKSHMDSPKMIDNDFIISDRKPNHPDSYAGSADIRCGIPFGKTNINCEIRKFSAYNYSFKYCSDLMNNKILCRLDVGNGAHRNKVPGIPLEESQIPTPHFHEYREDGYMLAYKIEGLDYSSEESLRFDFYKGNDYFCRRLDIKKGGDVYPEFKFKPVGRLDLPDEEIDPNLYCDFNDISE